MTAHYTSSFVFALVVAMHKLYHSDSRQLILPLDITIKLQVNSGYNDVHRQVYRTNGNQYWAGAAVGVGGNFSRKSEPYCYTGRAVGEHGDSKRTLLVTVEEITINHD